MQVQQKLDDAIKNLDQMQKEQDSLSKQDAQKNLSKEDQEKINPPQDSLNKKFDSSAKHGRARAGKIKNLKHLTIFRYRLEGNEVQQQQREGSQNQNEGSPKKASDPRRKRPING